MIQHVAAELSSVMPADWSGGRAAVSSGVKHASLLVQMPSLIVTSMPGGLTMWNGRTGGRGSGRT